MLKWLIASAGRSFSTAVSEQLRLLPLLFKVKHLFIHSLDPLVSSLLTLQFLSIGTSNNFPLTYLRPLFQIAPVENDDSYDELKRDAKTCLSLMSQGLLYSEQIPMVLRVLQEVSFSTFHPHHWAFNILSLFTSQKIISRNTE